MNEFTELAERLLAGRTVTDPAEYRAHVFTTSICPRLRASGLPERFWREITAWNCAGQEAVFNLCRAKLVGVGAIVALAGIRGTGKTTIAGQLIIERAWRWYNWHDAPKEKRMNLPVPEGIPEYRKLTDLISFFKPLYADFGSIDTERLIEKRKRLCENESLLIIDELHDCEDQKLKERVLTDICDRFYAAKNDVLLISNQEPKEFHQTTSDSVISRIGEHGQIVKCAWPGWRTAK